MGKRSEAQFQDRRVAGEWQAVTTWGAAAVHLTRQVPGVRFRQTQHGIFVDTVTVEETNSAVVASGRFVMHTKVLMLNRSYLPIHVTSVRRAFTLLYLGIAKVVNEHYETFDFERWRALTVSLDEHSVGLVDRAIRVPRVILLSRYDRVPRRQVRFSRVNIYARDNSTCQYCGKRLPRHQLNLDHVIPRSRGGTSRWDNVVCSCVPCNRRKGGRTPQEARMKLLQKPCKPTWTPFLQEDDGGVRHREWLPFLPTVDVPGRSAVVTEEISAF